jgi:diphthine-ammonia ligase
MISSGLNAILIKIAGAGLVPSDLARPLSSMQPKLLSLRQRFGTHPCGEGGEYETFTTDCPLFQSCIDIKVKEVVVVDESDVAPVAYLRIKHALLVKKEATSAASLDIPVPPLLEPSFETLHTQVEKSLYDAASDSASGTNSSHPHLPAELGPSVRRIGPWIAVGNVHLPTFHPRPSSVGEEVTHCFEILQSAYRLVTVTLSPILSTRLAGRKFTRIFYASGAPPDFGDHFASPSRPRRVDIHFC